MALARFPIEALAPLEAEIDGSHDYGLPAGRLRHTRPDILHLNVDGLVTAPVAIFPLYADRLATVPPCFDLSAWRDLLRALVELDGLLLDTWHSYDPERHADVARFGPARFRGAYRDRYIAQLAGLKCARRYLFSPHTGLFRFDRRPAPESGHVAFASIARIAEWKTDHPDNYLFLINWLVADLERVKQEVRAASPPSRCRALFEETFRALGRVIEHVQKALPPTSAPDTVTVQGTEAQTS